MNPALLTQGGSDRWLWDKLKRERREVKFRLKYDGPLPSASKNDTRCKDKNRIRWKLHHQLATVIMEGDFSRTFTTDDKDRPLVFPKRRFKGFGLWQ